MRLLPLIFVPGLAFAQAVDDSAANATDAALLDSIVVVASRAAEPLSQVVASVAQVEREDLERHLVHDLEGLTRYVPGIGITRESHRFGNGGFSIRGLEGNRVRILVDGIPLADAYSIGQFASAGRDLVDLEAIERIEILRGPASTLYGSDALAGVVAFRTRDPADLLARSGDGQHIGLRFGWDGMDDSFLRAASWAGESEASRWQAMAVVGRRSGHEADNRAWRAEDGPNPIDYTRDNALAKLVHDAGDAGRYVFTVEANRNERETEVNSLRFGTGRYSTTYRLDADDRDRRDRISLAAQWQPQLAWLQSLDAQIHVQDTSVRQDSDQYRLPDPATPFESLRWRRFEYDADAAGLTLLGQARHDGTRMRHWHVFGVDLSRQRYEGLRDGLETNLVTGATSSIVLGEPLPVRDFPNTDADSLALFWQDEIGIGERFAVIPGLRAEWYRLRAKPDAIFIEDFPDADPVDIDERQVTPRLGLRWLLGGGHSLFAQYARGFRAPPFGDVNIGLILPVYHYEVRANPDLRPERSHGVELGWRHVGDRLRASASIYENRYRDLIESRANLGIEPGTGLLVFQSVNRDRARIRGVEADLLWRVPFDAGGPGGWQLRGALAWSQGDDLRRGQPLNSIDPGRITLGLRYEADSGRWGVETAGVAAQRKSRIDHQSGRLFAPPGYGRLDLYAWVEPWQGARINAGLVNLADRRYWDWSSIRGVRADANDIGFFTRPGRSLALSLAMEW
ncbi:TonB-dependent hemoglobin/transferrin/lactoferrin family receptor [Dokdonella sp.]|uniref:TonB-dependent hemoglobin/transferrin/lactoferrin family receptor n=1 Tax=Dokdonella sp. TaxID=2291710 RepID=UPI0025B99EDB|nr:TonB-dependent hemoglobin/transferrin/lactoferrin family receptor [Dokdonella sp.]MBX3693154.1 TonB-dependent hemoglobin/transferrin/lactoferrin family receptor [Dokdonella sp.]